MTLTLLCWNCFYQGEGVQSNIIYWRRASLKVLSHTKKTFKKADCFNVDCLKTLNALFCTKSKAFMKHGTKKIFFFLKKKREIKVKTLIREAYQDLMYFVADSSLALCASSFQIVVLLQSITSALTLSWSTLCLFIVWVSEEGKASCFACCSVCTRLCLSASLCPGSFCLGSKAETQHCAN